MDHQSDRGQLRHTGIDMGHHFRQGMRSNLQPSGHVGCLPKSETVFGLPVDHSRVKFESPRDLKRAHWAGMANSRAHVKAEQSQHPSPEPEAGRWLYGDVATLPHSSCLSADARNFGGPRGTGIGESQYISEASVTQSGRPKHARDVTEDVRLSESSPPDLYAQLRARLRATQVRESVIVEAIERLGGGQKGLQAVVKFVLFWLREKNRSSSQPNNGQSDLSEVIDELVMRNAGSERTVDAQFPSLAGSGLSTKSCDSGLQGNITHMMSSMPAFKDGSESLCDLTIGCNTSGNYEGARNYENQSCEGIGELGMLGGLVGRMGLQDLMPEGSSQFSIDSSAMPVGGLSLATDNLNCASISRLTPSPEHAGLLDSSDIPAYNYTPSSYQRKVRRLSPPFSHTTSSQGSSDFRQASSGTSAPDVLGPPGMFSSMRKSPFTQGDHDLLSLNPLPMDPRSPDNGPFTSFTLQESMAVDENLVLAGSMYGSSLIERLGSFEALCPVSPEASLDPEQASGPQSRMRAQEETNPSASTRLNRKIRMDRNRKATSQHASRAAASVAAAAGCAPGPSRHTSTSGPVRNMLQSQAVPATELQTRTKDRGDQEDLQFLLQKKLKPSDVSNLGRIVLPKKDSETHLPWLEANEGVPFACEDYDNGEKILLRYRFWPNNKSRMYILENTGDFVKKHQLQESDRLCIYRNKRQGTYIIRGRKARDCVNDVLNQESDLIRQSSSSTACSSGTTSNDRDVGTSEGVVTSDGETRPDPVAGAFSMVVTLQADLMNFADLPDAPMGEGAENLVRFPSLEAFDVEMLDLIDKQDPRAAQAIPQKEDSS